MKQFLMGNEILARAAFEAGAQAMFGYPITPTTEVLATWAKFASEHNLISLQTEDEMAAGFGVCGVVLAGKRAFTATGGPGMILMQDPLSMAEAMRLPMVVFDGQRGGPSTGQVIYSQQEVNLAIYGGNGEGLRIVYSTSSLQDLYDYGKKVFDTAWKYRFPTILLYDGYQGKMKGTVEINEITNNKSQITNSEPILTTNLRNTYNLEEELAEVTEKSKRDFDEMAKDVVEYESIGMEGAEVVIFAHGIVASAVKKALALLKDEGFWAVGLFRPITLSPFPAKEAMNALERTRQALVFESSLGQFSRLLKGATFGVKKTINEITKPGVGFAPEEIRDYIKKSLKED
ncbi:MAG: ferredoxin oxidoreductase [bacterium]|nr:ferredoxin oxidoreductase [bacterium]